MAGPGQMANDRPRCKCAVTCRNGLRRGGDPPTDNDPPAHNLQPPPPPPTPTPTPTPTTSAWRFVPWPMWIRLVHAAPKGDRKEEPPPNEPILGEKKNELQPR